MIEVFTDVHVQTVTFAGLCRFQHVCRGSVEQLLAVWLFLRTKAATAFNAS